MLNVLDLFSGIGGFSLGLERTGGFQTVAFCEIDPYCRAVLAKHWPGVPCFDDVRTLRAAEVGAIDLVCGGFPCQPFSHAGKRMGSEDDRALWPEYRRLIEESGATWVVGENVVGLIDMGLDAVLDDLEALGYTTRTFDIPACAVGARHVRRRIWIVAHSGKVRFDAGGAEQPLQGLGTRGEARLAYPDDQGPQGGVFRQEPGTETALAIAGCGEDVSDADQARRPRQGIRWAASDGNWWAIEPDVGRVAYGIPNYVDRIAALGNAVVPQIPEIIGRAILEAEGMT